MDFYKFVVYVLILYAMYYLGMISFDYYMSKKMALAEDAGEDIDISSAMSKYVPKDAQAIVGTSEQDEQQQEQVVEEVEGENEPVEIEYSNGFSALELHEIFEQEAGQNFFRGIIPLSA